MTDELIFDSYEDPIPEFRKDLQVLPVQQNGDISLCFYDVLKYTPSSFALDSKVEPLLSLLNGRLNIRKIVSMLGNNITDQQLMDFIQLLDRNYILNSDLFKNNSEESEMSFEQSHIRPAAHAGEAYPEQQQELFDFLDNLFLNTDHTSTHIPKKALYAPHIDPAVGSSVYVNSFSHLRELKPRRVVILATSHYAGLYPDVYRDVPFIGSEKAFEMPLRLNPVDIEYIGHLKRNSDESGFTIKDRAHRIEHSIELHLLFLNYVWKHDFQIVPILVNSLDDIFYMKEGVRGKQIQSFTNQIHSLDDPDTFYLISGDLSHVGRKFGDTSIAASMKTQVKKFDDQFLKLASGNQQNKLYNHMKQDFDPFRICGFPPLYTFLKIFPDLQGSPIDYHWWDEPETGSAVSFGAISY